MACARTSTAAACSRTLHFIAAGLLILAMARSAAADDQPVYTKSKDFPLPQGVSSWAAVMADVLQNKEGSPAAASKVLLSFQSMVQGQLAKIKSDLQAGKAFPELPMVKDLQAFQGGIDLNPSKITALSVSSAFIDYHPCLVSEDAVGAAATAVGLNIVPQVINVAVKGASALPIGVNINPSVIIVNPQGANTWPRGVNIQPTLIAVVPTGKAVVPVGVQVAPYGIAVGK